MLNFYFQTESLENASDIKDLIYKLESDEVIEFEEGSSKVMIFMDRSITCFFKSSADLMFLVKELKEAGNFYIVYWNDEMYGEIKNMQKDRFQKEFDGLVFLK